MNRSPVPERSIRALFGSAWANQIIWLSCFASPFYSLPQTSKPPEAATVLPLSLDSYGCRPVSPPPGPGALVRPSQPRTYSTSSTPPPFRHPFSRQAPPQAYQRA